jgi:alcohol dehydrogenase
MAESISTDNGIPLVMKAVQQSNYGEIRNVLTIRDDVPVPRALSSKQILVRVHAASINPVDWKLLNGNLSLVSRYSFPHIPGSDVAGVVVDIGSGVKRFQIGDQVYGNAGIQGGSYAEYVRTNESFFALKPKNLTMEEAAAVPLACETSYQALFTKISPPVGAGTKIFICGGSTATGLFAIQLAKAVGAQVATTSSQRNFTLLEKLGLSFYSIVYLY